MVELPSQEFKNRTDRYSSSLFHVAQSIGIFDHSVMTPTDSKRGIYIWYNSESGMLRCVLSWEYLAGFGSNSCLGAGIGTDAISGSSGPVTSRMSQVAIKHLRN